MPPAPTFLALAATLGAKNDLFITEQFERILYTIHETKCVVIRSMYIVFCYAAFLQMVLQEQQYQTKFSIQMI